MQSERDLTASLGRLFATDRPDVAVGIGDDAAVVRWGGRHVAVTCDPVVDGVHFSSDASPRAVGRKAVLRCLSDLAAMGSEPQFVIVSALLPEDLLPSDRDAMFAAIGEAARELGAAVVGGGVAATPGPLSWILTAFGELVGDRALRRSLARTGDALYASGPLGGSIASGRHLEPRPRFDVARWLVTETDVDTAMDLSDGLALDLWTMLEASGCVGAELFEDSIPIHPDVAMTASTAIESALCDGEDYELLFTVRAGSRLPDGGPLEPSRRAPIGHVIDEPGLWIVRRDGTRERVRVKGYQHDV